MDSIDKIKIITISFGFLFMFLQPVKAQKHDEPQIKIIESQYAIINQIIVAADTLLFAAVDGGILHLNHESWLIEPNKESYCTSIAFIPEDSSCIALCNRKDSTEIIWIRMENEKTINRVVYDRLPIGLYNIKYSDGLCYIWGRMNKSYVIGTITSKGIAWIYKSNNSISDVTCINNELYFASDNKIINLTKNQVIIKLENKISGFHASNDGKLTISCFGQIFFIDGSRVKHIAFPYSGKIYRTGNIIYVLDVQKKSLIKFKSSQT
jgi:hypothetical protein